MTFYEMIFETFISEVKGWMIFLYGFGGWPPRPHVCYSNILALSYNPWPLVCLLIYF